MCGELTLKAKSRYMELVKVNCGPWLLEEFQTATKSSGPRVLDPGPTVATLVGVKV